MSDKLDEILYDALPEDKTPSDLLNHQILKRARMEGSTMKSTKKSLVAAAVAVCILFAGGGTAIAAYRYLSAKSTAEYLGSQELAGYFEQSEVVSTCEDGDYRFIYLGNASAKLKDLFLSGADTASTYVALAIERLDGKPMTDEESFVASPLIQGLDPLEYNIYTMSGGATWKEKDGVKYMILCVDSVEMFADRTVYLAITTGPDYRTGYVYDESTGMISANSDFDGINALFEMTLDAGKADKQAQEDYLNQFKQDQDNYEIEDVTADEVQEADAADELPQVSDDELINQFAAIPFETLDSDTIAQIYQVGNCHDSYEFKPDADGSYHTEYENEYGKGSGMTAMETFTVNQPTLWVLSISGDAFVELEYNCRDENDILHTDYLIYDREQMQAVLQLLKK